MPYYDGYYTRNGEYLCVAYPTYPSICFTTNNVGLPQELRGLEDHAVTIRMKEKGGCLDVQRALSMKYTNVRTDYPDASDAQFANARNVVAGNIPAGILYRSSSPFSNEIGRAYYVSEFMAQEKDKDGAQPYRQRGEDAVLRPSPLQPYTLGGRQRAAVPA